MAKERIVTGIDIGSSKICTIIASVSDESRVGVIGVSSIPSRGMKKGVVVDIDDAVEGIAESLEGAERMAGYAVSNAFVTVDGGHITSLNSRGVVAVANPEGEIGENDIARVTEAARAVSIPANREIVHVIPRDFVVDAQEGVKDPIGMSGIRLEVETNIVSGSTTAMRNLVKCVQQVGVDVEDLVFGGVAAARAVITETEKELGAALLDIGGDTIDVLVFADGSPVYSSVLPIGGKNITNDLAIGLRTTLENAEKIKIKLSEEKVGTVPGGEEGERPELDASEFGLEEEVLPKKLLNDVIKARLSEIFSLVNLEIKKSGCLGKLPAGVVLTGGGSQTYGLTAVAKQVLKMPVRIAAPTGVTGLIDEIQSPAFAASVGLVLFGATAAPKGKIRAWNTPGKLVKKASRLVEWLKSFLP